MSYRRTGKVMTLTLNIPMTVFPGKGVTVIRCEAEQELILNNSSSRSSTSEGAYLLMAFRNDTGRMLAAALLDKAAHRDGPRAKEVVQSSRAAFYEDALLENLKAAFDGFPSARDPVTAGYLSDAMEALRNAADED